MAITFRTVNRLNRNAAELSALEAQMRAEKCDAAADSLADAIRSLNFAASKLPEELRSLGRDA